MQSFCSGTQCSDKWLQLNVLWDENESQVKQIREDHAAELERCETELRHADIELQAERRRVDEYAASNAQLDADRQKRPRDGGGHPAVGGKRPMVGGKQPVGATASVNGEVDNRADMIAALSVETPSHDNGHKALCPLSVEAGARNVLLERRRPNMHHTVVDFHEVAQR